MVARAGTIRRLIGAVVYLVTILAGAEAFAQDNAPARGEVEGFSLEIPDEHGQTQGVLEGSKAFFDPGGTIQITDAKAKIYQKDRGAIEVLTPKALYHRNSKVVTTDDRVKVDSNDTHITGKGLVWEPEKAKIFIRKDVTVVLHNVQQDKPKGRRK